jgi:hypothetical protein
MGERLLFMTYLAGQGKKNPLKILVKGITITYWK